MPGKIELEGFEEFENLLGDMSLSFSDKRRAVKKGITLIGEELEKDTPVGESGKLSKIKISVKEIELATEGTARSNAFYDVFQNFGTSEQKAHVGYFDRSVEKNTSAAVSEVAKIIFDKMR
ncbi:MAG: HK97-gp10 family putative phage morphogenesis protein [Clostridium sp.]|uniref:HK97-gp10 family putative phage morphogenesis protein n=1 Tax=Clostridium sp. TaxID=1506 RepID=UPI003F3C8587